MASFTLQNTEQHGNFLVAKEDIVRGDYILRDEKPFVWNSVSLVGHNFHEFCGQCGLVLENQLFSKLATSISRQSTFNIDVITDMLKLLKPVAPSADQPCPCPYGCDVKFCSAECQQLSVQNGHAWLCEKLLTNHNSSQQLLQIDEKGHFGQACKVYAQIASQVMLNLITDKDLNITDNALIVANNLLSPYHYDDFTRTMHAYRTGRLEIDSNMFENIIFPAYFSAHLATPLLLTKDILTQTGSTLWGLNDTTCSQTLIESRNTSFMNSEIFSEQYYSRIIGMFTVNCLSVYIPSPLDYILSEALCEQLQSSTTSSNMVCNEVCNESTMNKGSKYDPVLLQSIITCLQELLIQQQTLLKSSQTTDDDDDEGEDEHISSPIASNGHFLGMSASGLFPIFSKSNHSCLCNTSSHGSDRVTVSLRATENIQCGNEITNCYIHHDSLNNQTETATCVDNNNNTEIENEQHKLNKKMTKKQRYRALRQYMFECECPLCRSQEIDSDEDSD